MSAPGPPLRALWLTTDYPWADDPVSGIFHRTAARSLVEAGVQVRVISPTPFAPWPLSRVRERWRRYADAPDAQQDKGVIVERPKYPALPGDPGWARSERFMARTALQSLRRHGPVDIVHAHYAAPTGMAARSVARTLGVPYVITLHGSEATWRDAHPGRLAAYRRTLREASALLAVSDALADETQEVVGIRPRVLPIGIEMHRFAGNGHARETARAALDLPADAFVVLLVATLLPQKGVRQLVDAVIELGPPFHAVLVGEGPEYGYRADEEGARDRVFYHGQQPNEAIPTYLAAGDVFVLASETEGLPTVLVEAGAAGVAVVATPVGGIPELLGEDRGLLLDQLSPEAIAGALRAIRDDPDGAGARAGRLRRYVHDEYDATTNGSRLADLYRTLVAGATPSVALQQPGA